VDDGRWTMDDGRWTMDNERRATSNEQRATSDERRATRGWSDEYIEIAKFAKNIQKRQIAKEDRGDWSRPGDEIGLYPERRKLKGVIKLKGVARKLKSVHNVLTGGLGLESAKD
jgi:hypothetical protein